MQPLSGRILGLGGFKFPLPSKQQWSPVAQTILQGPSGYGQAPKASGVMRATWQIVSVLTAGRIPPRVRIGWSIEDEAARGTLLSPSDASDPNEQNAPPFLLADAWSGTLEIAATSLSIQAGWVLEDGAVFDGVYAIQGWITQGGTGAKESATFTRPVSIGGGGGTVTVYVPGSTATTNNGASRIRAFNWLSTSNAVVTIEVLDFAGVATQTVSTGALLAPGFSDAPDFPLDPAAWKINITAAGAVTGKLLFSYV